MLAVAQDSEGEFMIHLDILNSRPKLLMRVPRGCQRSCLRCYRRGAEGGSEAQDPKCRLQMAPFFIGVAIVPITRSMYYMGTYLEDPNIEFEVLRSYGNSE